jgi:acyl-CoA synthetase (NDP forming)
MGEWSLRNLFNGGFRGEIYPVNPGYQELEGLRCYASLAELPAVPDLVIFAVSDQRIEAVLDDAIAAGVPAAVIMSTTIVDDDRPPLLRERLRRKIQAAGMVVCGTNCMGFYNVRDRVWACGFDSAPHAPPGNVTLISHSGAGMSGIIDCDARVRINLAVSAGNEISVTMDEYLDFALDLPETRVVGLFIETARNPAGFRAALEKARRKRIPVVALKVGRTEKSARLTVSHSGAMAGDDAAYDALFDRYGVIRVLDMDELATTLILFAELGTVGPGGLVTLHDSGGERQLLIDLADEAGVELTELGDDTTARLRQVIDPELPAVNPLDAWSRGGEGYARQMTQSLSIMLADADAAVGAAILNRAPGGSIYPVYLDYLRGARDATGKPVALVAARQGTGHDPVVVATTHAGIPVLDGVTTFLKGVRGLFAFRDFLNRDPGSVDVPAAEVVGRWSERLQQDRRPSEREALGMLADFGLPVAMPVAVNDVSQLAAAGAASGFPVVLKTATPGIAHKSDQGGVVLAIGDMAALESAYTEMAGRLGPAAVVAPMAAPGVEMILGATQDEQLGPVVMLGVGGVLAETLGDVRFLLPPFGADEARRAVDRLRLRPLLDGARGARAADVDAFCEVAARFSAVVAALADPNEEVDLNPVIVHERGCTVVDALVIGA